MPLGLVRLDVPALQKFTRRRGGRQKQAARKRATRLQFSHVGSQLRTFMMRLIAFVTGAGEFTR